MPGPVPAALTTPYLMVDIDVLRRNLATMAASATARGMALRPHAKTHKCIEIAGLQLEFGAVGLTVATVGEAEIFAAAGMTDIFIAYPIWATGMRGERLRTLAGRAEIRIGVDSGEAAEQLARALRGAPVQVLVEVDCGHHRSGVTPDAAGEVARVVAQAGLDVAGVFTFPGHSYGPGAQRSLAGADEANALDEASAALRRAGFEVRVRSGGSTPSAQFADPSALTELRPGVYAFNDTQQLELGSCRWSDIALSAAATVVSARPGMVIVDAGSKVLGADRKDWNTGAGRLPEYPEARVVALSEHHASVHFGPGVEQPGLGEAVRVVPNHVCAAINLVDEVVVVSEGREITRWQIAARGANT
jgi:D-serine deaminase-like pyridoxal phosphate-dependent protein